MGHSTFKKQHKYLEKDLTNYKRNFAFEDLPSQLELGGQVFLANEAKPQWFTKLFAPTKIFDGGIIIFLFLYFDKIINSKYDFLNFNNLISFPIFHNVLIRMTIAHNLDPVYFK